jgi:2-methylisocitrate lyase-like PEP mutase family enzyme
MWPMPTAPARREQFRRLHQRGMFVMPNPWDAGSARLLEALGFPALATTSAGFAWALGKDDGQVSREELLHHVAELAAAVRVPLSVDSERCFADDADGVAETVALLAEVGAAGCSIEDWNPATGGIDPTDVAVERVAAAADGARRTGLVLTARAENHLHGVDDLDDTIDRLRRYRAAGAEVVYAPGIVREEDIAAVVTAAGCPVNVLALPSAPPLPRLAELGVRRVSTGSLLARTAYGALAGAGRELLGPGTARYADAGLSPDDRAAAFGGP